MSDSNWPMTAGVILRLHQGWELFDDHGTLRWYSETKPGFDDVLPTDEEVALIRAATGGEGTTSERNEP